MKSLKGIYAQTNDVTKYTIIEGRKERDSNFLLFQRTLSLTKQKENWTYGQSNSKSETLQLNKTETTILPA